MLMQENPDLPVVPFPSPYGELSILIKEERETNDFYVSVPLRGIINSNLFRDLAIKN